MKSAQTRAWAAKQLACVAIVAFTLGLGRVCLAVPVYLDAANPQGIPDISQDNLGICGAASAANLLWEWGRYAPFDGSTGNPVLVPHSEANWPTDFSMWAADGQSLRNSLATQIYGANFAQPNPAGGHGMAGGITEYINSRSQLYVSPFWPFRAGYPNGLSVHVYNGNGVTYTRLKNTLLNGQNQALFANALINIDWVNAAGNPIRAANNEKVLHSLGVAGFDDANTDLYLTNGWGTHAGQANPVSTAYYDHYTNVITDNSAGGNPNSRIRIPANANNNFLVGLTGTYNPPQPAAYCEAYQMITIVQGGSPSVGLQVTPDPSDPGNNLYTYDVYNDEPNPQQHFFLELPQSFLSMATNIETRDHSGNVLSGWSNETWNPGGTVADPTGENTDGQALFGSFTSDPTSSANFNSQIAPDFTGIHFYDSSASLSGGIQTSDYDQFTFDLPSTVDWTQTNTDLTVVGESGNEADYYSMIGGPVIPEPSSVLIVVLPVLGLVAGRRRSRRPCYAP